MSAFAIMRNVAPHRLPAPAPAPSAAPATPVVDQGAPSVKVFQPGPTKAYAKKTTTKSAPKTLPP